MSNDQKTNTEQELALDVNDLIDKNEPVMSDVSIEESNNTFSTDDVQPDKDRAASVVPVPPLIKYGFIALVVIIFSGITIAAYYIWSSPDDNTEQSFTFGGDFEIDGASIESGAHAPLTGAPSFISADQLANIESDIDSVKLYVTSLQATNTALQDKINALTNDMTGREQQLDELRSMLAEITDTTIPALTAIDKQHTATLTALRDTANKNKRRINQATKRKAESPPFALLSIDDWGATTSAVLEIDRKTTVASVGDVRAGWRITKIVRPDCVYAVRVTGDKTVKVCGAGSL